VTSVPRFVVDPSTRRTTLLSETPTTSSENVQTTLPSTVVGADVICAVGATLSAVMASVVVVVHDNVNVEVSTPGQSVPPGIVTVKSSPSEIVSEVVIVTKKLNVLASPEGIAVEKFASALSPVQVNAPLTFVSPASN
jgi:hypothetical protein